METVHRHKVGIYQITDISKDDAYYEDKEELIGMYFTFLNNSIFYTYQVDSWVGTGPGVSLLVSREHPRYSFLCDRFNFFEFKYRRVL